MFELSIIRKYLIPRRKQLSVTLIASMSVAVIALVVWLVLVFLSVTEGIERSWLEKLTSLNAPVRINPTNAYYSSYYYKVDSISAASNYRPKSVGQKLSTLVSDPYNPSEDPEIPASWQSPDLTADGSLRDPVKTAFKILEQFKQKHPDVAFQDYEVSGAMLRLQLVRTDSPVLTIRGSESQSFLTQVSYLSSFADQSPYMKSLILKPTVKDINHLLFLSNYALDGATSDKPELGSNDGLAFREKISQLMQNLSIHKVKTSLSTWRMPLELLPEKTEFKAAAYLKGGQISHLTLSDKKQPPSELILEGILRRNGTSLLFNEELVPPTAPLFIEDGLEFKATFLPSSIKTAKQLRDLKFSVAGSLQGKPLKGELAFDGIEIADGDAKTQFDTKPTFAPLWSYSLKEKIVLPQIVAKERGILLAKNFQDGGVRIGDSGYLSYQAATASGPQEQRLPVYVAGFYDPGIMSVGSKCVLVHPNIAHSINMASHIQHFDKTMANGFQVWFENIKDAKAVQTTLEKAFEEAGIGHYWSISTFHDYDFAKDLLQQFQSDRYLFTLIGVIILTVACCNIISLLVILVNDKKREIGILAAMGASPRSIALIFGGCGATMGILSSFIGIGAALLTLHNLDGLVHFLSFLQGHDAFNTAFYGASLPNHLSHEALYFVLIATPLISLLAGLVPAIKACRLRPSEILRSE